MPKRTCLGCRKVMEKASLVRLTFTPDGGIVPDASGRLVGRGAYLCPAKVCIIAACKNKGVFSRAFKRKLGPPDADELIKKVSGVVRDQVI